jgi:hypothetical protein
MDIHRRVICCAGLVRQSAKKPSINPRRRLQGREIGEQKHGKCFNGNYLHGVKLGKVIKWRF